MLMEALMVGVTNMFEQADDAGMPWEGGYVFDTYGPDELADEFSWVAVGEHAGELVEEIRGCLTDKTYASRWWIELEPDRAYAQAWESFREQILHRTRFVFWASGGDEEPLTSWLYEGSSRRTTTGAASPCPNGKVAAKSEEAVPGLRKAAGHAKSARQARASVAPRRDLRAAGVPPKEQAVPAIPRPAGARWHPRATRSSSPSCQTVPRAWSEGGPSARLTR